MDARTESQGARSEADEGATPTGSTPLLDPEQRAARGPSVIASSAAELAAAFPVQRVPAFPEALLHKRGQPLLSPEVIERIETQHWKEGPNLVKAPIEAGGMVVRSELYFLWVEGGEIVGWMPASELPHGGMRRGDWLLWWGGHYPLEAMHDRPTDAAGVHHEAPNLTGRDLERREEAGAELNHDLEHFVAVGSSLSAAMKQTESVHQQVLEIMVVAVESTLAGEAMGAGLGQVEGLPQLASTVESKLERAMGKATSAAPKASEAMKGLAQFADEVPEIAKVKQTPGVINGMRRLFDLFEDLHVTKPLRNEYLGELRQRLARPGANPEELFKELRATVEATRGSISARASRWRAPTISGSRASAA